MVLTSSTALLLLSLNTAILLFFLPRNHLAPFLAGPPCCLSTCYLFKCMRKTLPLVISVENTFPLVITVGNTFPLVITIGNTFPLVITVENTFPLLITVWKNNGSSFFLIKRGTSEMSSMGHHIF